MVASRRTLALALLLLAAPAAAAEERADGFGFAPYVWIPGLTGTIGAPGGDTGLGDRVDVDFSRFTESLRVGGAMVNVAWRSGRWVAYGDYTYANVGTEAPTKQELLYQGVEAQIVGHIFQGFGGYTLLQGEGWRLDGVAGGRGYSLLVRLALQEGALAGRELEGDVLWGDAVAGARAQALLGERWQVYLHADVGAGGSHLTWQALGAVGYWWSWGGVFGGYRHLAVDYADGAVLLDIALSGPIVGVLFAFRESHSGRP